MITEYRCPNGHKQSLNFDTRSKVVCPTCGDQMRPVTQLRGIERDRIHIPAPPSAA